jgi:hypothetical protein
MNAPSEIKNREKIMFAGIAQSLRMKSKMATTANPMDVISTGTLNCLYASNPIPTETSIHEMEYASNQPLGGENS